MTEKEKIINKIITILNSLSNEKDISVYLFGSYSKEENSQYSDIGLLIISNNPALNIKKLLKDLYKKTVSLSKDLNILGYSYLELKSKLLWSNFFNNIIKTGEIIYEKRI
jgi:predicted nucleotidyltransferase